MAQPLGFRRTESQDLAWRNDDSSPMLVAGSRNNNSKRGCDEQLHVPAHPQFGRHNSLVLFFFLRM
jgi:hypothetical protein